MKKNNKGRKANPPPVRVPSWDPVVLNRDLLNGFANDPAQGTKGWAYGEIREFVSRSFLMGHNPLETLRKVFPQWTWSVHEVKVSREGEGEGGPPITYHAWCGYYVLAGGGEDLVYHWTHPAVDGRVFGIQATRPVSGLGFAAKTAGAGEHKPRWVIVEFNTPIGVSEDGYNTQQKTDPRYLFSESRRFRDFAGLVPAGTRPTPVEKIGESRGWQEGSPSDSGRWGRSGYQQDYRMPDGTTVVTELVITDEWP